MEREVCTDLKLCDFGLSSKFSPKLPLSDFCGSPGFFAPEMIIEGIYYGDKADVWSTGCILLELILGHERFCDAWMSAYDYDVLQDKAKFTAAITATVDKLPSYLEFSDHLNDFTLQFLSLDPLKRPSIHKLCEHEWLTADKINKSLQTLSIDPGSPVSASTFNSPQAYFSKYSVTPDKQNLLKQSFSQRERKMLEDYNTQILDGKEEPLHLPPIEPATPSVGKARKILQQGQALANKAVVTDWDEKSFSPMSSPVAAKPELAENSGIEVSSQDKSKISRPLQNSISDRSIDYESK